MAEKTPPIYSRENLQRSLGKDSVVSSKVFLNFKSLQDEARTILNHAIDLEEAKNTSEALKTYQFGISLLDQALNVPVSAMLPQEQSEATIMQKKLSQYRSRVLERITDLKSGQSNVIDLTSEDSNQPRYNLRFSGSSIPIEKEFPKQSSGSSIPIEKEPPKQKGLLSGFISNFFSSPDLQDFSRYAVPVSEKSSPLPSKPKPDSKEVLKGIDKKAQESILNEVVEHDTGVRWNDIAGLDKAKQIIMETVILPMLRPDLFTGLRSPIRGLLFFGPPGNGKTMIAKALANEAQARFFNISASTLMSKWLGEGEKMVRALFAVARYVQPTVIFIDEIDSLLCERSSNEHEASRRLKTEFLLQFDGVGSLSDDRILVMGATNRPADLDEAARRRFAKRIYIPLPTIQTREGLLGKLLSKEKVAMSKSEFQMLLEMTEGYSCSDLTQLAKEAAMEPIRSLGVRIQQAQPSDIRPLTFDDFSKAVNSIRPSVSQESLEYFEKWNKEFGSL